MTLDRIVNGVNVLKKYTNEAEILPIPKSYGNGQADFSTTAYLSIPVPFDNQPIADEDRTVLTENGWVEECEGDFWVLVDR